MSNKNKTAVEQLHEQSAELLSKYSKGKITFSDFMIQHHNLIYQALEMEKQMIIDAYKSDMHPCSDEDAEQYYNETFKP